MLAACHDPAVLELEDGAAVDIQPLGATAARFFTNAIDTETKGYDLVGNYQRAMVGGRLDLSAAYSRNETDIVGVVRTPPELEGLVIA